MNKAANSNKMSKRKGLGAFVKAKSVRNLGMSAQRHCAMPLRIPVQRACRWNWAPFALWGCERCFLAAMGGEGAGTRCQARSEGFRNG